MGESLLQFRHPALDRLYTIWRLLRVDNRSPPASAADSDLLREWQDHLVIVEANKTSGALRELHIGAAVVGEIASSDFVRAAIAEISNIQQPILVEESIGQNERYTALLLPFCDTCDGVVRVMVAIYHAPQVSNGRMAAS
ncbi:MAG: hypothetical protein NXI14_06990 [bacterium]|nr:hypothetical protein [bacterium]